MYGESSRSQSVESRQAWFRLVDTGFSVTEVCRLFGMSRKTYYKWRGRYEQEGVQRLEERSRCPKHLARLTPAAVAQRVVKARKRKGYGPSRQLLPPSHSWLQNGKEKDFSQPQTPRGDESRTLKVAEPPRAPAEPPEAYRTIHHKGRFANRPYQPPARLAGTLALPCGEGI